jgi:hypothetical protein
MGRWGGLFNFLWFDLCVLLWAVLALLAVGIAQLDVLFEGIA